ncbi:hypothetical protein MKW98_020218, partial [Papaver atlanticum]
MAQGNSYEEARKQRLKDNKRRFEELGVLKMANNLIDGNKTKKQKDKMQVKSKKIPVIPADLVRRSSRPRNQVTYSEDEEGFSTKGKEMFRSKICKTSYITTRLASEAERLDALKRAMSFQRGLLSGNSSFVKSLSLSHVSGSFQLGIPLEFRNNHLSKETKVSIVLEDGEGLVYETNFNGLTGFLNIGWKLFSMDHKLDDGDALVIELIEPTRFKFMWENFVDNRTCPQVHILKVSNDVGETSYIATRVASKAERSDALKRAMSFQSGLLSGNPSFVKSMSHSYVSKKSVLRIPSEFRKNHLPKESKVGIVFEDGEGLVYETIYNGVTGFLITGWKLFSMDHKLDDGDALVMELVEPTRFKVHLFKVSNDVGEVKVDQPKKARGSKYAKTVDAEHITKPTGRTSRNSKKAEL